MTDVYVYFKRETTSGGPCERGPKGSLDGHASSLRRLNFVDVFFEAEGKILSKYFSGEIKETCASLAVTLLPQT